jgi:predicted Zn-dependent protease
VAIEPGRYTAVLEPQAVCDLVAPILDRAMERTVAEMGMGPFADPNRPGFSKIGQQVLDPRLTLSADPMDPDCGFVPFDWGGEPYPPTNWIDRGVLRELAYSRNYGLTRLGIDAARSNSRAFRLSGGTATIDELIANTERGILVTRFNNLRLLDFSSMLMQGNTRDGLWLIERGKIAKTIKNFRVTESPLFVLNNVEQLGLPQRVYRPGAPAVCPPVMARDFSFTGLMDAV